MQDEALIVSKKQANRVPVLEQDRLIAELETAKNKDIAIANKWLREVFIER